MKSKVDSYLVALKKGVKIMKKNSLPTNARKILGMVKRGELFDKIKRQAELQAEQKEDWIKETDRNKVWAFCSGQYSNDFRGNPKYLFIYINKYRKDITSYWLCDSMEIVKQVRAMGYRAYQIGTPAAELAMDKTGVFVAEQVKAFIPSGLAHAKYLNLWHGVGGVKAVERSLTEGKLAYELAKKYIEKNNFYANSHLYLAPSEFIENIAIEQLGIAPEHIIKAGYPRNIYQKNYERISTFSFDWIEKNNLPKDTRIVAYAPTYRNQQTGELFAQAIPDMKKLIQVCEENHLLMIFKMHPLIEKEMSFLQAKEAYKDCKWLCFWDNSQDFYEVMDQVDLCIMDFSSIFTDFIACGVKHFMRYIFDIDPETLDFPLGYDKATLGTKCRSFDELLAALADYSSKDWTEDIERIRKLYWEYDTENSMDEIIDRTVEMKMEKVTLPTLYSFDIFDTLISREGLAPESIFYWVKEQMEKSALCYPKYVKDNYPSIRKNCELNCREYYNRSRAERGDDRCEIQFEYIFRRMQVLYDLSDEQIDQLMAWELEAELKDTIPLKEQIDYVKTLLSRGETVALISDMYLPKEVIRKMLYKADPVLAELPLFLSSEYGYQKSDRSLYLEVFKSFDPYYNFGRWIHHGDHPRSDGSLPESLNINTVKIEKPEFNEFEAALVEHVNTYDAYLIAAKMTRFRQEHGASQDEFVYSYISMLFVPYVYWAIHDAIKRGDKILYFVSRDGHHLKRIADVIIEQEKLPIETKYIYASRRTWRIPSFIDHIDVGFWGQGYGNFGKLSSYDKMLKALDMEEEDFRRIFPELSGVNRNTEFKKDFVLKLIEVFRGSAKYEEYLLKKAAQERVPVCGYLKQEIDTGKQFSIVEYWGRGYTQENFTRLWQQVVQRDVPSVFYYSRSTLPSDQYNIRRNFTCNSNAQQFIEAIFANMPYRSIERYKNEDGKWIPEIKPLDCDTELFDRMQEYLPLFAKDFCGIPAEDRISLGRGLIDFAISFYVENQDYSLFTDNLAHLVDSVELYGNKVEYARELTEREMDLIRKKVPRNQISKSIPMSFARSSEEIRKAFMEKFQLQPGDDPRYGTWLSENEILKNRKFAEKKEEYQEQCQRLREAYEEACKETEVKNKVLILFSDKNFEYSAFRRVQELLNEQGEFETAVIKPADYAENPEGLAAELADAKFVLMEKSSSYIGGLKIREETKLIMLGDTACFFQPARLLANYKLREEAEYNRLKEQMDIAVLQTPSEKMEKIMKKIYSVNSTTDYSVKGCCATDCYFDEKYREEMKELLLKKFPEAEGKKVICYAPQHRFRSKKARYAEMLNLQMMEQSLGGEYVVLVNVQEGNIINTLNIKGFSKNMTKVMPIRGQMAIADIVVGDYRNLTLEAVLMDKPLFLTCWDYAVSGFRKRNLFRYEDLAEKTAVSGTEDLIDKIKNIDSYDYSGCRKFRKEYMTYCDGKSSERLCEYLMQNK